MGIVLTGAIEKISTRKDGSRKVEIGTQEMGPEETAKLFEFENIFSKIYLTNEGITQDAADQIDSVKIQLPSDNKPKKKKTQSQRLRDALYILWSKTENEYSDFDNYYEDAMERLVSMVKDKIPDED